MDQPFSESIADGIVTIPRHVVLRDFLSETVLLNIETGQYHGLNPTAGRMLQTLERLKRIHLAIPALAQEFEQPVDRIEQDLMRLCEELLARGLIVISPAADG